MSKTFDITIHGLTGKELIKVVSTVEPTTAAAEAPAPAKEPERKAKPKDEPKPKAAEKESDEESEKEEPKPRQRAAAKPEKEDEDAGDEGGDDAGGDDEGEGGEKENGLDALGKKLVACKRLKDVLSTIADAGHETPDDIVKVCKKYRKHVDVLGRVTEERVRNAIDVLGLGA